jgi:hypothetical protein
MFSGQYWVDRFHCRELFFANASNRNPSSSHISFRFCVNVCSAASPHPQGIRKITLKHSHIIATTPAMGAAISCKNLVSSSSSARTCFAQCLALFNSLVVLPGAEVVPAPGAVVVSGGVIVLLAFGTAIELFLDQREK